MLEVSPRLCVCTIEALIRRKNLQLSGYNSYGYYYVTVARNRRLRYFLSYSIVLSVKECKFAELVVVVGILLDHKHDRLQKLV
ncbi:hypothetical protein TIFTF001_007100 [Ficus carica]|uniref:Uncharacterized protein n=1 Tax=Ficus carica TaxID=3494 RepID=A0AA88A245_FICCA|nr:hypothetical protein TIFTF001_007100 [Ficus carica]